HLVSHGMIRQREADLRGARSIAEIQERLRAHRARQLSEGGWLLGRAFDQDLLAEGRWPTRADLEAVSDSIPIRITRVCGHALVVNSAALRAAEIAGAESAAQPSLDLPGDPAAGGGADLAAGLFTEEAMAAIHRAIPPPADVEWLAAA